MVWNQKRHISGREVSRCCGCCTFWVGALIGVTSCTFSPWTEMSKKYDYDYELSRLHNFHQGKYDSKLKPQRKIGHKTSNNHFCSYLSILHHFQWNQKGKVHMCNRFHWLEVEDQYILRLHNTADHSLRRRQFHCHRTFLCILPGMRIPCKQTCCSCWPGHYLLVARTGLYVRRRTC